MGYAEVAVNAPVAQRRTFSYGIPPSLSLSVGQAVWVPFGARTLQGIVCRLSEHPEVPETKDVIGVIDPRPLLTPARVELARWVSEHYLAPLFDAAALMLPPGFERKLIAFYELSPGFSSSSAGLTPDESQLAGLVEREGRVAQAVLEKALGQKKARRALDGLLEKGGITRSQELEKVRVRARLVPHVGPVGRGGRGPDGGGTPGVPGAQAGGPAAAAGRPGRGAPGPRRPGPRRPWSRPSGTGA